MEQNKLNKQEAIAELWRRGNLSWKLHEGQKELYSLYYNSKEKTNVWLLGRRCLAEGTLIKTPTGLVEIQNLKIGDVVYGVNKDGTVTITTISDIFQTGEKEVVDLVTHDQVLETATLDHVWLTTKEGTKKQTELTTKELTHRHRIIRKWVNVPGGTVVEPHAYALGALLGDGCSKQVSKFNTKKIFISSEKELIPKRLAEILKCLYYKNKGHYTWVLSTIPKGKTGNPYKNEKRVICNRYKKWCFDKYAHEKFCELDVIKTWCRSSQLQFLAGLIDTDGSVRFDGKEITISLGMQSLSCIQAAQYIIHNNFQFNPKIQIENRNKYKNGPIHFISIKNILICKKILKALTPYLVLSRKKYKPIYDLLKPNNSNSGEVSVKLKNPRIMKTWDISVNNETNLYLTANGLVTHNCGKTYSLVTIAVEQCLRQPNSIVKFIAPTKTQVDQIVRPLFKKILDDCPSQLKPRFITKDYIYYFPNGSEIQLAGTDGGHAEKLRGQDSHLAIVDEAGTCQDLEYIVKDILLPTTLLTKGKVLLASTPPKMYDHDFIKFIERAEANGTLVKKSSHSNPMLTEEDMQMLMEELGGKDSDSYRREVMCEIIRDQTMSVIPEFTEEVEKEIVKEWHKPPFYDAYVGMDLGFRDLTALVFGYYDFKNDKVVIEDELVLNFQDQDTHLPLLVEKIKQKELLNFTDFKTNETKKPLRVSDLNPIVTQEIGRLSHYDINFISANKKDKEASLNKLRVMISHNKLIINPKCVNLIRHIRNARWQTNSKSNFARSKEYAHFDLVDALIYLVDCINYNKNPYPDFYQFDSKDLFIKNKPKDKQMNNNNYIEIYKKLFNPTNKKSPFKR